MNSAIRRHHYKRLQKKRRRYWWVWDGTDPFDHTLKQSGMVVATPAPCGRACCENPRKYFNEKSIQERRSFQGDLAARIG